MNKAKLTSTALAISAAAAFAVAPVFASSADTTAPLVQCKGGNACKGQSTCKTPGNGNSCKGQNACKGKGSANLTQDQCLKAGGTVVTSNTSS